MDRQQFTKLFDAGSSPVGDAKYVSITQRIECQSSKLEVVGLNPTGDAKAPKGAIFVSGV